MLKADPNLERSMTICQGIEKIPIPAEKLYNEKASIVHPILDAFFAKVTLFFMLLMFKNYSILNKY